MKKKAKKRRNTRVYVTEWSEYEEDYGTRPDGYSLHISETGRDSHKRAYSQGSEFHSSMPMNDFEVEDSQLYAKVLRAGGTLHVNKLPFDVRIV